MFNIVKMKNALITGIETRSTQCIFRKKRTVNCEDDELMKYWFRNAHNPELIKFDLHSHLPAEERECPVAGIKSDKWKYIPVGNPKFKQESRNSFFM